jgi:hypothetical protein
MSESPIGNLKSLLIAELTKQVQEGSEVVTKDGEVVRVSCPASVLSVAAKVVKDFHEEAATADPSVLALDAAVKNYQLRKAGTAQAEVH